MKTRMHTIFAIVPLMVAAGALLCACGKTQEPPARDTRVLGGTPHGAPVDVGPADTGILQDQGQYRPASFAGETGRAEHLGPAAGADAVTAARELVDNLLGHIASGEVELALGLIDADQIRPLLENTEFLRRTFELQERLAQGLQKMMGDALADQLPADMQQELMEAMKGFPDQLPADIQQELGQDLAEALKGFPEFPPELTADMEQALTEAMKHFLKIDPVDADTAVVSPNVLGMLFGPAAEEETLTVVRRGDRWHVRLERTLTAADVAEIRAFHEQYQEEMKAMIDAVERGETDPMKLMMQMMEIMTKFTGGAIPDAGLPGAGEQEGGSGRLP